MKASLRLAAIASACCLLFVSCDTVSPDIQGENDVFVRPGKTTIDPAESPTIVVDGFTIRFDGRAYDDEADETSFDYSVIGPGEGEGEGEDAYGFQVERPECAPEGGTTTPHTYDFFDSLTQIFGPLWDVTIGAEDELSFGITFEGSVPLGIVNMALSVGENRTTAEFLGPCDNIYDISGFLFTDANSNGAKGPNESGLEDVTVVLHGPYGYTFTDDTASDGAYLFDEQFKGDYVIEIVETPVITDFNEELLDSFTYTGGVDPQLPVTIGPESEANNFGFAPDTDKIIDEIGNGEVVSESQTFRFWRREMHKAANFLDEFERDKTGKPKNGRGKQKKQALINEMQSYADAVEALLIASPYQFESDNELRDVYEILNDNSKVEIDRLVRELLVTELNFVSTRGISNRAGLGLALIGWGEGVVSANQQAAGKSQVGEDVRAALNLFSALNSSGGGGAVDD